MKYLDELERRRQPLTVKEAADIYGENVFTFYRRIHRGEVPGVFRDKSKPKGRIRICPAEFVPWLRQQMTSGCHPAGVIATLTPNGTQPVSTDGRAHQENGHETRVVKRMAKRR